ncbi:MAG: hypothetical protein WBC07_13565 [Methylotenera sp.]
MEHLGFYLIGIAILIFVLGRFSGTKRVVKATNGSVAVGENNNGQINVTKIEHSNGGSDFLSFWDLLCGICSILGLVLVIWPIK